MGEKQGKKRPMTGNRIYTSYKNVVILREMVCMASGFTHIKQVGKKTDYNGDMLFTPKEHGSYADNII